ncbi:MAG: hypothetical protein MJK11_19720 [Pseudomonadales bacterium]|nr:hypothetical protein [Pseudomonadales bacterium]
MAARLYYRCHSPLKDKKYGYFALETMNGPAHDNFNKKGVANDAYHDPKSIKSCGIVVKYICTPE